MTLCGECGRVNGHHPNCPEAEDWEETDEETEQDWYYLDD